MKKAKVEGPRFDLKEEEVKRNHSPSSTTTQQIRQGNNLSSEGHFLTLNKQAFFYFRLGIR